MQALALMMSARSDTFVLRTCGETGNPATGWTEDKAWLEAVVQRMPQYINSFADSAEVFPPARSENQNFGRRFKVVFFRLLTSNDL